MPAFDQADLAFTLPWDADWVCAVAFVGPKHIAAGNNLGEILVWELAEKADAAPVPKFKLEGHTNQITRLKATKDGTLYSTSYDRTLRVWRLDAKPGNEQAITLNARAVEQGKRPGSRKVEPIETKVRILAPAHTLDAHKDWINGFDISRDEKVMLTGDDGSVMILWDREKLKEIRRWKIKGWCYACGLSPDATQAVITERLTLVFDSGRHAGVRLWDVTKGEPIKDLAADFKGMQMIAAGFTPDGKSIILGRGGECDGTSGKLSFVNPETGKKTKDLDPGHLNGLTDYCEHPDGKYLFSCGRDTQIRIWEIATGKMVKELGKGRGGQFKDWIHAVSISRDGAWLVGGDMIGAVVVYKLR